MIALHTNSNNNIFSKNTNSNNNKFSKNTNKKNNKKKQIEKMKGLNLKRKLQKKIKISINY